MIGMRGVLPLQRLVRQIQPIRRLYPDQQPAAIALPEHATREVLNLVAPLGALVRGQAWRGLVLQFRFRFWFARAVASVSRRVVAATLPPAASEPASAPAWGTKIAA